jgi:excisionase family DNA binding protein
MTIQSRSNPVLAAFRERESAQNVFALKQWLAFIAVGWDGSICTATGEQLGDAAKILTRLLGIHEAAEEERRIRLWRSRSALNDAPELAMHVRSIAISGRAETGETLREWSAPMMITASDAVDEFFAQLVDWRLSFYRWLEPFRTPLLVTPWTNDEGEAVGFAAGTTPALAQILVRNQTSWLLAHSEAIALHPSGATFQEDVTQMVWSLRSKFPTRAHRERPVLSRPCPVCGELGVQAEWYVKNEPSSVKVECALCGYEIPVRKMRNGATDEWLPTTTVVTDPLIVTAERKALLAKPRILPSEAAYLVGVTKRTVNRWIADGLPTYAHWDRNRRVKLAEVRDWKLAHPPRP